MLTIKKMRTLAPHQKFFLLFHPLSPIHNQLQTLFYKTRYTASHIVHHLLSRKILRFSYSLTTSMKRSVIVGDFVCAKESFMKGSGTRVRDSNIISTVAGFVVMHDKLASVDPLKRRYEPEIGHVVVGRVIEVQRDRWRLDILATRDAILSLSAIILPSGEQRRRTTTDELNMRNYYVEGDLVCAEVQRIGRGAPRIHTRNPKFGKLGGGVLVNIPHYLIERGSRHFAVITSDGVGVILGKNGAVWITAETEGLIEKDEGAWVKSVAPKSARARVPGVASEVSHSQRKNIAKVAFIVRKLAENGRLISPNVIQEEFELENDKD